jgi:hypothetical protein
MTSAVVTFFSNAQYYNLYMTGSPVWRKIDEGMAVCIVCVS